MTITMILRKTLLRTSVEVLYEKRSHSAYSTYEHTRSPVRLCSIYLEQVSCFPFSYINTAGKWILQVTIVCFGCNEVAIVAPIWVFGIRNLHIPFVSQVPYHHHCSYVDH